MIRHLMDEEGNILSFADFQERFPNVGLDFLTYFVRKEQKPNLEVRTLLSLFIHTHGQLF